MATALDRAPSGAPARRRLPVPLRTRRLSGRPVALAVVVALAAAVAVTGAALGVGLGRSPAPVHTSFAVPAGYHVTYAVTAPNVPVSSEQLWVRRPFDSVDITYSGPPPGSTPTLVLVYRLGVQVLKAANAQAGQLRVPAAVAPPDVRADVLVGAAIRAHRLRAHGTQVVLGRSCQVFRSAAPLRSGPLPALGSGSTYVDTCLDADGIVLRETQVRSGHVVSDRRAVQVAIGASAVTDAPFDMTGSVTPFDSGGGAFTALTLDSRPPGRSWALPRLPAGFMHLGRFAVVPPQPQAFSGGGEGTGQMGLPGGLVTEMDDVFVRGADAVVLQQGSTINGATFTPPANAVPVQLGALGEGQLLIAGNATTLVAEPGNRKQFVRLSATLPADAVVALMRSLLGQSGGTLTRLQGGHS